MKAILAILLVGSMIAFKFEIPEVKVDQGMFDEVAPLMNKIRRLGASFIQKKGTSAVPSFMNFLFVDEHNKYHKCVKAHLCKAHKVAKIFVRRLWRGNQKGARKVLKCLHAILLRATKCKKRRH